MKVYGAKVNCYGNVVLCTFPTKAAFELSESWIDPKWIRIATTKDLAAYEFPYEKGMVVYTEEQIAAWNKLHEAYKKH